MVSTVVDREQSRRMARVSQHFVEIDYSIEFSAAAYPVIDLLTYDFFLGTIKGDWRRRFGKDQERVLERWVRRPNDSNSLLMGAPYEFTIAGYHALGSHPFGQRSQRAREGNVVDTETHDDVLDASLSKHVAIETCQARLAEG